jgi:hypothetical protein
MINEEHIEFPETPITEKTFIKQGWLRVDETEEDEDSDGEGEEVSEYSFYYFVLPLPKDNPDSECKMLISNCNDEYKEIGIPKGQYYIELENAHGLGFCQSEEEIEILYRALTGREIYED